jgi:hypothetical protein
MNPLRVGINNVRQQIRNIKLWNSMIWGLIQEIGELWEAYDLGTGTGKGIGTLRLSDRGH